jgi:FecR protein
MRQIIRFAAATILGVVSFFSGAPLLFAQQGYVHEASGNVTGQVGAEKPAPVDKGMAIAPKSTISTGPKSHAVLKFEDGTVVLLKENTSFQLQTYSYAPDSPDKASAMFNLLRGGLRVVTGLVTSKNKDALSVATPLATIRVRGTDFTAELTNPLFVGVSSGAITLSNTAGTQLVIAGQYASVASMSQVPAFIQAAQLPPGALQFPNVALPPTTPLAAGAVAGAGVVGASGGTVGGVSMTTAAIIGAAVIAGVAASAGGGGNGGSATPPQH